MPLSHHILAKETTDAILANFKSGAWSCASGVGKDFYRTGTSASFPSPDAAFYDPINKIMASFEFKPLTETKRGILTGVGQSIAYLQECNLSFLVAPKWLSGYDLGSYLTALYKEQIVGNLPMGLILYDNGNPKNVSLTQNVSVLSSKAAAKVIKPHAERFWAKHQDLPVPLFHLILHYYYLGRTKRITGDPFAECWLQSLIDANVSTTYTKKTVLDINNNPIKTVAGTKDIIFLEKTIKKCRGLTPAAATLKLASEIDVTFTGDNYYNSIRKNYITFLKHIQMIDSNNTLTDAGFKMYHLGLVNGPSSKIFMDYFTKEVLTTGHHLDLILDFDTIKQQNPSADLNTVLAKMETDYEVKGYIKRNPGRTVAATSTVNFLKYERILWKSLGLIDKYNVIQWKKITEICSLPDL